MTREEAVKELKYIQTRMVEYTEGQTAMDMAIEALSNNTTEKPNDVIEKQNDVIEVVRCRDCVFYKDYDGCFFSTAEVDPDDYCAYGERRCEDDV